MNFACCENETEHIFHRDQVKQAFAREYEPGSGALTKQLRLNHALRIQLRSQGAFEDIPAAPSLMLGDAVASEEANDEEAYVNENVVPATPAVMFAPPSEPKANVKSMPAPLTPGPANRFGIAAPPKLMTAGYRGDISTPGFAAQPIVRPEMGESRNDFMTRCIDDPVLTESYQNLDERRGVCGVIWNDARTQ